MALGTFTELKDAIADWLDRSDLTARIPDFTHTTYGSKKHNVHNIWTEVF